MNNTGGLSQAVGSSLCHFDLYCMSDFSEEKLLDAIDRVKVKTKHSKQIKFFQINNLV
jgi:hypothetical protein